MQLWKQAWLERIVYCDWQPHGSDLLQLIQSTS